MEIISLPYKNGKVLLRIPELKELQNIDVEKVTRIQHDKLVAEIYTFPVVLNRLGLILAEAESSVNRAELDLKIGKANLAKQASNSLIEDGEKATENNIMHWIRRQPKYRELNETYIEAVRKKSIVNSAYWSAKGKADTLNKLTDKIHSDEMSLDKMITEINGIKITYKENLMTDDV